MSAGISISFRDSINAFAKAHDLDLASEAAANLDVVLQSTMRVEGGQVSFRTGEGQTGTIEEALDLFTAGTPRKANRSDPTSAPTTGNATARALAANAAMREGRSTASLVEAQALVDQHGSPWNPRSINRTRQALISNLHPDLAARLKRQAGVRA